MAFNFFRGANTAETTIKVNYDGKEAEKGLRSLTNTLKTVVSAYVIKQIASYTANLANLGAEAQNVGKNFANFALRSNKTVDEMMMKLRDATLGMVNDMELQQRAMQAMVSGVKFDDIIVAMEYVTKFAAATGTDVSSKMMTVMTGLARGSAQFLDDVGIQVIGSKDVVNDAIKQMTEKMDQFTTSEEDASVKSRELKANLENIRITIAQKLVPAWGALVGSVSDFLDVFTKPELTKVENEIEKIESLISHLEGSLAGPTAFEKFIAAIGGAAVLSRKEIMNLITTAERELEELKQKKDVLLRGGEDEKVDPGKFLRQRMSEQRRIYVEEQKKIDDERQKELEKQAKKESELLSERNKKASEWLDKQTADLEENYSNENEISLEKWEERNALEKQIQKLMLGEREVYYREQFAMLEYYNNEYNLTTEEYELLRTDIERKQADERQKIAENEFRTKLNLAQQSFNSILTITNAIQQIDDARTQKRIDSLDKMELSESEYNKKREQILEESRQRSRAYARIQQGIAIGEAWVNVYKAAAGTFAETTGGYITRALAMAAAIAQGALTVSKIQSQNFESGQVGIGGIEYARQKDTIPAMIGKGESVISAPATAMHEDTLRAIQNNTANTASGMRKMSVGGSNVTNNFYGVSTEQMLSIIVDTSRKNRVGRKI